ncbi:MAG: CehA/McbA family metallohydrolase [Planctomycetaceae bacterium]
MRDRNAPGPVNWHLERARHATSSRGPSPRLVPPRGPQRWPNMSRWLACACLLTTIALGRETRGADPVPLRVEVVDAETGRPLACRVYLTDAQGEPYFARPLTPAGKTLEYNVRRSPTSHEQHSTVSADPFGFQVPAQSRLRLICERGKEYLPVTRDVQIADRPETVQVELRRFANLPQQGWYSGDTHLHRRLEDCGHLVEAEDLHVAFPLTYWVREAYLPANRGPQAEGVVPQLQRLPGPRFVWPMNTEYELFTVGGKPHTQGAVFVLNHKEPLDLAAPPVAPIGAAARQAGALLDLDKHSWNWTVMIVPLMPADLFEVANNHVWRTEFLFRTWTIEQAPRTWDLPIRDGGLDEQGWVDWGLKTWYAFLNCGFRLRPTGGTGSGVHPVPAGFGRVYVHTGPDLDYDRWVAGLNAGQSFVTTGPLLPARFNDQLPGHRFKGQPGQSLTLTASGTAESVGRLRQIEVVVNGEVTQALTPANEPLPHGGFRSTWQAEVTLRESSWVAVRCWEESGGERLRYAHTAPVHVEIDGPVRPRRREVAHFIERMEQEIARNTGVLADAEVAEYRRALEIYRDIARRARD